MIVATAVLNSGRQAMTMQRPFPRPALAAAGIVFGFASGLALAQAPQLAMLARLEPGLWEVRARDGSVVERVCLDDGRRLIQLRHPRATCRQVVVGDEASSVTVHYTCGGRGSGRTHVRMESPRLVQLDSAGIAGQLPFDLSAEARRVRSCTAS